MSRADDGLPRMANGIDLHTHHSRCGHATGGVREYVEAAWARGAQIVGISDHAPFFGVADDRPIPSAAMARSQLGDYYREMVDVRDEWDGRVHVLGALEVDFSPATIGPTLDGLAEHEFDYLIGSVHSVDDEDIFLPSAWQQESDVRAVLDRKRRYYELVLAAATSGGFQVMGHIDAIEGNWPGSWGVHDETMVADLLDGLKEAGVAIEVNTSGTTKRKGGWYPSGPVLEGAARRGIPLCFGSDAHSPSRVLDGFEAVFAHLQTLGVQEMVYFDGGLMRWYSPSLSYSRAHERR